MVRKRVLIPNFRCTIIILVHMHVVNIKYIVYTIRSYNYYRSTVLKSNYCAWQL